MSSVMESREALKHFYAKYELYVKPCLKCLLALFSLAMINKTMGHMGLLSHAAVVLMAALMCSFMPVNFIVFVSAAFVLGHAYALAVETALVALAVMALMFLFYFRFTPKNTLAVLLTPLLFAVKIPYVMPVAAGLLYGPLAAVPVGCGVIARFMVRFIEENIGTFSAGDAETSSQKIRLMLDGLLENRAMMVTLLVFSATVILVYGVRRLAIAHAWNIAIIVGLSVQAILLLICEFSMEVDFSVVGIIGGSIASFLICQLIRFMKFDVDYNRTETVQFEDDEYYYYVRAVPKNTVAMQEKQVKKINRQHRREDGNRQVKRPAGDRPPKKASRIKTSHGVSRAAGDPTEAGRKTKGIKK